MATEKKRVAETVREVLKDHIWWVPPDGGPAACWSANDHDDTPCGERFTTGGEYRAHVADLISEALVYSPASEGGPSDA